MRRINLTIVHILAIALCMSVAVTVIAEEHPVVEVVFCLDTTGSMGDLIEGAKMKIWSVANQIVTGKPTPELKIGLVGYRDIGDEYVTRVFPLTDDFDAVYENLMSFIADGGGDSPEHVNRALNDALYGIEWSSNANLKIIFLVGDAPPHMDYSDGYDWRKICREAVLRDVIINTIQCGNSPQAKKIWVQIARNAEGQYAAVPQTGGMTVVHTPYDREIAELSAKLEETVVAYGSSETIAASEEKALKVKHMAAPAAAERALYKSRHDELSSWNLVDAVKKGSVELEEIKEEDLPARMRSMSTEERYEYLQMMEKEREEIKKKISQLSNARNEYIFSHMREEGKRDSFDHNVQEIIKLQAALCGIRY